MKKIVSTFLLLSVCALTPVMPTSAAPVLVVPVEAGLSETSLTEFKPCPRGTFKVRRNTRTKKKLVNSLLAGGVGAAIGGGLGGGRGALLGGGIGAGSYLTYRYVRDRRGRCVARRV